MLTPDQIIANHSITEEYCNETKTKEYLYADGCCDNYLETLQGILRRSAENEGINLDEELRELPECELGLKKLNVLGEYFSGKKGIKYYKLSGQTLEIVQIHERFHAIHHLTKDKNGEIWNDFAQVPDFYLELLAQLFTHIYIRDLRSELSFNFYELNKTQPFIYQTFKVFEHYSIEEAEGLYWDIRENRTNKISVRILKIISKKLAQNPKTIDDAVFNGIRKTINRFREQPFLYFTESDVHASLSKDIMEGNSDLFIIRQNINNSSNTIPVSLVHHEYPTNFRFKSSTLKKDGYNNENIFVTDIKTSKEGDRGNYDLAILSRTFVEKIFSSHQNNLLKAMEHIINKDVSDAKSRDTQEEVLFAIEVKFIHAFNTGNIQMEGEVRKDNNKLALALFASDYFIKPINLVFCSSDYEQSNGNSIIKKIKEDVLKNTPTGVCSIFIESFFSKDEVIKKTEKPKFYFKSISTNNNWTTKLKNVLGV